ncbi:MAG: hypothetical protein KIT27_04245 [Legionellales bacterium]|nr:hypothetical protein [Legionellales bacterium]
MLRNNQNLQPAVDINDLIRDLCRTVYVSAMGLGLGGIAGELIFSLYAYAAGVSDHELEDYRAFGRRAGGIVGTVVANCQEYYQRHRPGH